MQESDEPQVAPKPWQERANTLGYINGGTNGQAFALRQVLLQMPCNGDEVLHWKTLDGKEASAVCETLCKSQLSSAKFVERTPSGEWAPTKAMAIWLQNDDSSFLARHIHANVKFFGEMLASIGKDTSQVDLRDIACATYGMNWTTPDQVHRRSAWLRALGLIEVWTQKVVRTTAGDELLTKIKLCTPEEAAGGVRTENGAPLVIDEEILHFVSGFSELDQKILAERRPIIGYIPRGVKSTNHDQEKSSSAPTAALRRIVKICGTGVTIDEFKDLCAQELGINKSSFNSMLHTIRHFGLVEQSQYNYYSLTPNAAWLVEPGHEKALIAHLHSRYAFFGEILRNLDVPASPSQLLRIGKEDYGYRQGNNGEIRVRLGFLQDAGLVDRIDWQRFRVTEAGKSFAPLLSLQQEHSEASTEGENDEVAGVEDSGSILSDITRDLKRCSQDGNESKALEAAICRAFQYLGFQAEHLGGSGQTDVIASAELAPNDRYRVIVDAKSSSNGSVPESAVNFDVLRDHKRKHKADYVMVVAPDFADRLKNWAVENDVSLLQADELAKILEHHSVTPISLTDLRETFSRVDAQKDLLFEHYQALDRRLFLMGKVLELAFQEGLEDDPIAEGYISVENVIYALRKEVNPRPSSDEIRETLEFLSGPFVAALAETKEKYKLADSPHNVSLRLRGLGVALQSANISRE